jgi:hydroxymethylpyrimidine/phosphomethylpyrimidine kinase
MKTVLTIAGSDCSGGAGIQADIKTMTAQGVYGMSVITALTAQNTMGVFDIMDVPKEFVGKQLDCVFTDIFPDAVKLGMVSSVPIIETIVHKLVDYEAKNIVLDPVMVSTSGSNLLTKEAVECLCSKLLPLATLITPNIPEAEVLSGIKIMSADDMIYAAKEISNRCKEAILIKGGHRINDANDLLYVGGEVMWFQEERIDNSNTHGTGCTLSSAIACGLAKGYSLEKSIAEAKDYICKALRGGLNLGNGSGPLNHCVNTRS